MIQTAPAWWRPVDTRTRAVATRTAAVPVGGNAIGFWALVAFTVILLLSPQIWFPVLGKLRIAFIAAGIAIGAHLMQRLGSSERTAPYFPEIGIALLLISWSVVTLPMSYWPGGSVETLIDPYLKAVAFFWLLGTLVTSTERLVILSWALVLCSVPLALTGMHNYLSGMFLKTGVPGLERIYGYSGGSGIASNPNDLALVLNLIIPIAGALILVAKRVTAKAMAAAAMLISMVAVVLTFSRGGFLTLAAIFLMYLWVLVRSRAPGKAAAFIVAGLLLLPFVPSGYADRLSTITDISADRTGSAEGRLADFKTAVGIVTRNPVVGAGIGQDILAMNETRGADWTRVHNAYLEYAVDLGVPGLLLFLWLYASCFRSARKVERRAARDPALRDLTCLAVGVQIALVAFGVAACFHPIAYQFYFFCVGGLAVALKRAYMTETATAAAVEARAS